MPTITKKKASEILAHLQRTGQGFCFYQGVMITRDDCEMVATGGEVDSFEVV